jgi:hypothetical protein
MQRLLIATVRTDARPFRKKQWCALVEVPAGERSVNDGHDRMRGARCVAPV